MSASDEFVIWMSRMAVKAPKMAAATASQSRNEAFPGVASDMIRDMVGVGLGAENGARERDR